MRKRRTLHTNTNRNVWTKPNMKHGSACVVTLARLIACFCCLRRVKCKLFQTRPRWVSSSVTLVCHKRSGAGALLSCSVFKRQPWQLHKGWELKQGSCCYFPGIERLSHIDQQWVCHKSLNLSPIRSLKGANASAWCVRACVVEVEFD